MTEYIEREAAEKVASKYGCTNGVVIGRHSGLADCIAFEIAKLPVADVAPVKHGKWILKGFHKGVCNQCHRLDDIDPLATHCRYCGAKMDLED